MVALATLTFEFRLIFPCGGVTGNRAKIFRHIKRALSKLVRISLGRARWLV